MAAEDVTSSGSVYMSLLPGSDDYEVVAKAVPAYRAHRVARWSRSDREALSRVLDYAKGFAANRGLHPEHPRLVATGDAGQVGEVYHALGSRSVSDPRVATFSSYDLASAAEVIARQAALEIGVVVPGMEGMEKKRTG
jgi:hypothetical protein